MTSFQLCLCSRGLKWIKGRFDLDQSCPSREESDRLWLKMSGNNIVFLPASFSLVSDNPSVVFKQKSACLV